MWVEIHLTKRGEAESNAFRYLYDVDGEPMKSAWISRGYRLIEGDG